jgi:hypothetical protein
MTPLEAIQAATITPARVMKLDNEVGTIEAGRRADLIVLDANPLDNISNIRKIRFVVTQGRMFETARLWQSVGFSAVTQPRQPDPSLAGVNSLGIIALMPLRATSMLAAILLLFAVSAGPAQTLRTVEQREKIFVAKTFRNARGETLLYRLFTPPNYDPKQKYPLVLYLHGGGGRGADNLKQIDGGNGYLIDLFTSDETQSHYASFVVAPQSPIAGRLDRKRFESRRRDSCVWSSK